MIVEAFLGSPRTIHHCHSNHSCYLLVLLLSLSLSFAVGFEARPSGLWARLHPCRRPALRPRFLQAGLHSKTTLKSTCFPDASPQHTGTFLKGSQKKHREHGHFGKLARGLSWTRVEASPNSTLKECKGRRKIEKRTPMMLMMLAIEASIISIIGGIFCSNVGPYMLLGHQNLNEAVMEFQIS